MSEEDVLQGKLYTFSPNSLTQLDAYEDIAEGIYKRIQVQTYTDTGVKQAWMYVRGPKLAMIDCEDEWDYSEFLQN